MLVNGSENEKLFAKSVPISIKDVYTNQSRTSNLFLTIEWQDASAGIYRKVLVISLTDNNDPFFLYNLHLSEEDFQMLKANQDLLINFTSFPQHIIDYIEICLLEGKNPKPKFLLVFTINEKLGNVASPSQLDIIETNQFKHLTHLSLKFVAATESAVKQYLASSIRNLKDANRQLQNNLAFLEQDSKEKIASCQQALNSQEKELVLLKKQHNDEITHKENKYAQELQEERERLLSRLKENESRFEREMKEKDHTYKKQIQQHESRVTALDTLNKELQEKNFKHESTIRDLNCNLRSLEEEIRALKDNLQSYRLKCDQMHSEAQDMQSRIQLKNEAISELQHKLRTKEQCIARLKEEIEHEKRQKKALEGELEDVRLQLDMSEKSRKVLERDKEELNEVIANLQDKARKTKAKIELSAKYKQTIDEKEKQLQDVKKESQELNYLLKTKNTEVYSLTESIQDLHKKIHDLENDRKVREDMIKYLNRQLTDSGVIPQYIPPSNLIPSPSSVAQKHLAKIRSATGQNSPSPDNSPSVTASNKTAKSVRIDATSPVYLKNNSPQHRFHMTEATDSAYYTSPSGYTDQMTPDNAHGNLNTNVDKAADFEIDPEALSAAFGNSNNVLKHSTAKKKTTKSAKSTIPKTVKKR